MFDQSEEVKDEIMVIWQEGFKYGVDGHRPSCQYRDSVWQHAAWMSGFSSGADVFFHSMTWIEGFTSRYSYKTFESCNYVDKSKNFYSWGHGWRDAEHILNLRKGKLS